jgi:hypothetical protein
MVVLFTSIISYLTVIRFFLYKSSTGKPIYQHTMKQVIVTLLSLLVYISSRCVQTSKLEAFDLGNTPRTARDVNVRVQLGKQLGLNLVGLPDGECQWVLESGLNRRLLVPLTLTSDNSTTDFDRVNEFGEELEGGGGNYCFRFSTKRAGRMTLRFECQHSIEGTQGTIIIPIEILPRD